MTSPTRPDTIRVLVTGFGPFLDISANPSWSIASSLPRTLSSTTGTPIQLIIPDTPVPAAYHKLLKESATLISQHSPHIVLHIGLAFDRDYFAVEQSALREGYHEFPDIDRKVITRVENKKLFGKGPASLATSLDLESAVDAWQTACARLWLPRKGEGAAQGKGKGGGKGKQEGKKVDVRLSDDVGTYVCGLIYYSSLAEMQKRIGTRDVVFMHIPLLKGEGEEGIGAEVTKELVVALVDVWEARS
ncbi:uncharacterized protein N0V89_008658 [Didymosphaeria variabile]|uniref:Peptidase C15, pyroglutamyl peptidase I-like protein n=1 Tax=Didymosphaeria variabile TaxID=1932322 RepID=A0A9W8XH60_9PLEO|nr:uncharacterized protein N0V89_008658 [Didymosphaeria variabile]KAJ4350037.1 hypothetical protein N0V89_008658 [Didymosphaeria variabile]